MKKRSSYRPREARKDNMAWVMNGMRPVRQADDEGIKLKIGNHRAMDVLRRGEADLETIDTLIGALNIAEALAVNDIGGDLLPQIRAGQDAMLALAKRGIERGKRFIAKGEELQAIGHVLDIQDAQLDVVTVKELEDAIHSVFAAIRAGRTRKIARGVQ